MDGEINGWIDKTDRYIDGWMDGWIDGEIN